MAREAHAGRKICVEEKQQQPSSFPSLPGPGPKAVQSFLAKSRKTYRLVPMKDIERTMVLAKSTLRLYISITLSHAEKGVVTQDENAKHNAAKIIRSIFPEFDGVQCEVRFPKGWGRLCAYLTKEDKSPLVWGEYTREQILDISECSRHHKKDTTVPNQVVLDNLSKCEDWFDIYSNEVLVNRLFRSYGTSAFDDLKVLKQLRTPLGAKFIDYLRKHNWPAEYTPEELKEKQLFLYGRPSTQKTLLVSFLSKVLRVYFGSSRRNDFTGADNYYDLWVFDQFHKPHFYGYSNSEPSGDSVLDYDMTLALRTRFFGSLTDGNARPGPLQERFLRLPFRSNLYELREERVISTLWGCFLRRICRNISLQSGPMSSYIDLDYNASRACGEDCSSQLLLTITTDAELARFSWRKAPSASSKYKYSYASADLYQSTLSGSKLSLLNFAIIPLEKPSSLGLENRSEETPLPFFHDSRLGSNFEFHRSSDPCLLYFLAWPIRVVNEASKEVAFGLDLTLYEGSDSPASPPRKYYCENVLLEPLRK
ncbi:hypothetical protein EZV62_028258 [Acer yangbiense]|uniref:Uncharacterized protein n=1 Tax=Acer yangbiense TaxID=1000413 RepID=A0A5C7GNV1_9ROSI|nr:hypothetical protein EZV62_028258 [Acer yangbiense]